MENANNLDAMFADAELPFGHPGRRFDDTPEGFEASPLMAQEPERDFTPDEDDSIVHYAPGDCPLCGNDCVTAVYTYDPARVAGCKDCLELVAEDLQNENNYRGHCRHEITAQGGMQLRRTIRQPCPSCGAKAGKNGYTPDTEVNQEQTALDQAKPRQASGFVEPGPDANGTFFRPHVRYDARTGGPIASW